MKGRVASRNVDHTLQRVYAIGKEELGRITAEDWKKAIDLASKQEALYAEVDGLQLDPTSLPLPDVQVEAPIVQESVNSNEIITPINLQKCSNCTFESTIPRILKKHLNASFECFIWMFHLNAPFQCSISMFHLQYFAFYVMVSYFFIVAC